jgi:ketosteroid isomerase-like protein
MKQVLAVLLVSAGGVLLAPPPTSTPQAREMAVRAALTRFLTAFENLDWDTFRACFDDDVTVFFPTPEPPQRFEGRAAVEAHFQQVFASIRAVTPSGPPFQKLVPEDLQIDVIGTDAALATFHLRNEQRIGRRTVVFKHSARGWRIAHLHASNMAPAPVAGR